MCSVRKSNLLDRFALNNVYIYSSCPDPRTHTQHNWFDRTDPKKFVYNRAYASTLIFSITLPNRLKATQPQHIFRIHKYYYEFIRLQFITVGRTDMRLFYAHRFKLNFWILNQHRNIRTHTSMYILWMWMEKYSGNWWICVEYQIDGRLFQRITAQSFIQRNEVNELLNKNRQKKMNCAYN